LAGTGFSITSEVKVLSFAKTIEISCEIELKKKGKQDEDQGKYTLLVLTDFSPVYIFNNCFVLRFVLENQTMWNVHLQF